MLHCIESYIPVKYNEIDYRVLDFWVKYKIELSGPVG